MRRLLLLGEAQHEFRLQPVRRDFGREQHLERELRALEMRGEDAVEPVVVALVLHQHRARDPVEVVRRRPDKPRLECLEERQEFSEADRHAGGAQH